MIDLLTVATLAVVAMMMPAAIRDIRRGVRAAHLYRVMNHD